MQLTPIKIHHRYQFFVWVCAILVNSILMAQDPPTTDAPLADANEGEPATATQITNEDGPRFQVDRFTLVYANEHADHPHPDSVLDRQVDLGLTKEGYIKPRVGVPIVTVNIGEVGQHHNRYFYASAIRTISESIVAALHEEGLIGIYAEPDSRDIDRMGRDLRTDSRGAFRLLVRTAFVTDNRTIASGDRVPLEDRINNERHLKIVRHSPLQPAAPGRPGDLLNRNALDEYLFRLNRHPGRRVDVSIAAGDQEDQGGVALDYLVSENKPWLAYSQVSNTGTDQTDEYRVRMGYIHHQLTNNDDILRVDYITAGFDEAHAFTGSYEGPLGDHAPFGDGDLYRWRVYGAWSDFTAAEIALSDLGIQGESWLVGGELIYNTYQDGPFFVDLVGGARFENIFVDNRSTEIEGEDDFLLPYVGIRLETQSDSASLAGSVNLETNIRSWVGTDESRLDRLGREEIESDFYILNWNFFGSMYLEPLLSGISQQNLSETPLHASLAHELAFTFRGQVAFDDRVIPQFETTIGGLYSVRGYTEALTSGDNVVIGGIEYRFHLPRLLPVQPDPSKTPLFGEPFRFSPQRAFGKTDWDLILKGFVDFAHAHNNDVGLSDGIEEDETLLSTGVGIEVLLKRNFNFRADWGFALRDAGEVTAGSNQFHFVAMLLY